MNKNPRKQLRWQLPLLLLLIVGTIFIVRQKQALPYQKNTGLIFGTIYNITYIDFVITCAGCDFLWIAF
jgi:thiamine biosynthesis lipoprotein